MLHPRTALLAVTTTLAALALGGTARGEGAQALDPFTAVHVEGSLDVRFVTGSAHSFRLVHPNASTRVKHRLDHGVLTLVTEGGGGRRTVVEVTASSLAKIEASGSGDLEIRAFSGKTLEIKVAGSGDVVATGAVETLTTTVLGSSDMVLDGLTAKRATVNILGSGDVRVRATGTLKISILGSGDVTYWGGAEVTQQILGSGDVTRGE